MKSKMTTNVAKGLGWYSIALGLREIAAGRRLARSLGLDERSGLIRTFGAREIVVGVGILSACNTAPWLRSRAWGDILDLGLLATELSSRNGRRGNAALALASVAGVAFVDIASGARRRRPEQTRRRLAWLTR